MHSLDAVPMCILRITLSNSITNTRQKSAWRRLRGDLTADYNFLTGGSGVSSL